MLSNIARRIREWWFLRRCRTVRKQLLIARLDIEIEALGRL